MTSWKIWTGLAVLFVSGLLIGGISTHCYMQSQFESRWESGPQAKKQWMMERLTHRLHLNKGQQASLAPLVSEAQEELFVLRAQQQPQVEAIWNRTLAGIKPVLEGDQQKKLDEFQQKLQRRWQAQQEHLRGIKEKTPPQK
jgi:hypothetical protein